jgi:hypothetical protein
MTISVVTRRKPVCARSGAHVDETKEVNIVLITDCDSSPEKEKVKDFSIYSIDHPPITL